MLRSWRDSSPLPAVWLSARILRFILNRIGLPSPYGNALPTLRNKYEGFSRSRIERKGPGRSGFPSVRRFPGLRHQGAGLPGHPVQPVQN